MRSRMLAAAMGLGVLAVSACSDRGSGHGAGPTSSTGLVPTIQTAQVLVGGRPVQGVVAEGTDEPTLFRVHVSAPEGLQSIERVVLRYTQPGPNHGGLGPGMMGGFRGTVLCYDDGTHGDDIAGDGIYSFMDPDDAIGCHGIGAPSGEYRYEFWCEDIHGQQSNVVTVTVNRR